VQSWDTQLRQHESKKKKIWSLRTGKKKALASGRKGGEESCGKEGGNGQSDRAAQNTRGLALYKGNKNGKDATFWTEHNKKKKT